MTLKKGDLVVCTNGHPIGKVLRDVPLGEVNTWVAAFEWLQQDAPVVGRLHKPVCEKCGAHFMAEHDWSLYIQGWRP